MYNEADQFSKSLLRDALSCASASEPGTEVEVVAADPVGVAPTLGAPCP
jgi:hypothetical protein